MGFIPLALGAKALFGHKDKTAVPPINPNTPGAIAARSPGAASAQPAPRQPLGMGTNQLSL